MKKKFSLFVQTHKSMHPLMHTYTVAIAMPITVIPVCSLQHTHPKQPLALPRAVLVGVKTQGISRSRNFKATYRPHVLSWGINLNYSSILFSQHQCGLPGLKQRLFLTSLPKCAQFLKFSLPMTNSLPLFFFKVSPCWSKASAVGAIY